MSQYVRYGDYLLLVGMNTINNMANKTLTRGYLQALGGMDDNLYYREIITDKVSQEQNDWEHLFDSENESLFRIIPKLNSKKHTKFLKVDLLIRSNKDQKKEESLAEKLVSIKREMEEEKKCNDLLIEKMKGKEVYFGDEVQLYHVRSRSCMVVDKKCRKSEKASYKIGLTAWPKKEAYFCIKPKLKMHHDGDFIQYNDQIQLFSFKMKGYLDISKDTLSEGVSLLIKNKIPFYNSLHPEIKFRENGASLCSKSAVLTSQSTGFAWMPVECKGFVEDSRSIRGNDFIYLQHTETESYLTVDVQQGEFLNLYLRKYVGPHELEKNTVQSIWQIQRLNPNSAKRSGVIKTKCKSIVLRNYFTGEVVTVDRNGTLHCLPHQFYSENTFVELKFTPMSKKSMKRLRNEESFCISCSANSMTFASSSRLERGFSNGRVENTAVDDHLKFSSSYFKRMSAESEGVRKYFIDLEEKKHLSLEDAFMIQKVPSDFLGMVFFLESSRKKIQDLITMIKFKVVTSLPTSELFELSGIFKALTTFVLGINEEEYNPLRTDYSAVPLRQKLCKDMRMIEILTDLIYLPMEAKMYQLDNIHQDRPAQRCFKEIYMLLNYIVNEYRPNEIYAAQWMSLFIHQSLGSHGKNSIGAQELLIGLLDNNFRLLSHLEPKIIKEMVYTLRQGVQNEVYIDLINALLICEGKVLEKNQEAITSYLFEEKIYVNYVYMAVKFNRYREPVIKLGSENIVLHDFQAIAERSGDPRFNFFKKSINLLANLCIGRNFKGIMSIREHYSFDFCLSAIQDRFLNYAVRSGFLRLAYHLYIDENIIKVVYPHHLRLWDSKIGRFMIDPKELPKDYNTERIRIIKTFVLEHLNAEAEKGFLQIYNTEKNIFLAQILMIVKKLINFGQFGKRTEVEKLYQQMMALLDGSTDKTTQDDSDLIFSARRPSLFKKTTKIIPFTSTSSFSALPPAANNVSFNQFFDESPSARYEDTPENRVVVKVKLHIIKIIIKLDRLRMDQWISSFLNNFRLNTPVLSGRPQKTFANVLPSKTVSELKRLLPQRFQINNQTKASPLVWLVSAIFVEFPDFHQWLICILLDLLQYKNNELSMEAFRLYEVQFSKSREFLKSLKNVFIVEEEEHFATLFRINALAQALQKQANRCELWITTKESETWLETISELHMILKGEKRISSLGQINHPELYRTHPECGKFDSERISEAYEIFLVLKDIQLYSKDLIKLFLFEQGEKGLLTLLRFNSSLKSQTRSVVLCQLATINTLVILCNKSKGLEVTLMDDLEVFLRLMGSLSNVNAHILVRDIIKNKPIIYSVDFVKRIIKSVLGNVKELINKSVARAASLLSILDVCILLEGKPIKHNQTAFMSLLSQYPSILFLVDDQAKLGTIAEAINTQKNIFEEWLESLECSDRPKFFDVSPYITYFATTLSLVNISCQGFNKATESISKKLYSLNDLSMLLRLSHSLPFLKSPIWGFFYYCHIDAEHKDQEPEKSEFFKLIIMELKLVKKFFKKYGQYKDGYDKGFIVNHNGPVPVLQLYVDFLMDRVCPILIEGGFTSFFLLKKEEAFSFSNILLGKLRSIQDLIPPTEGHLSVEINRTITQLLSHNPKMKKLAIGTLQSPTAVFSGRRRSDATLGSESMVPKTNSKTLDSQKTVVLKKTVNGILKKIISRLEKPTDKNSVPLEVVFVKEQISMINSVKNIGKMAQEIWKGKVNLGSLDVYNGLLRVLKNSKNPEIVSSVVRVFRGSIESKIGMEEPGTDTLTIAEIEMTQKMKNLGKIQGTFVHLGLPSLLISHFTMHTDRRVREQVILGLIAVLKGGNLGAQSQIHKILSSDLSNSFMIELHKFTEKVFEDIKCAMKMRSTQIQNEYYTIYSPLIKNNGKKKKKNQKTKEKAKTPKRNKNYEDESPIVTGRITLPEVKPENGPLLGNSISSSVILTEDESEFGSLSLHTEETAHENPENEKKSKRKYMEDSKHYSNQELVLLGMRLFKLFKHLCEGHFRSIQDFLREQQIEGRLHPNSVNFLDTTLETFAAFVKYMNADCLGLGINIIDFLIESAQGPCEDNQRSLCSFKVVDKIQLLFHAFPKQKDLKTKLAKRGMRTTRENKEVNLLVNRCISLINALIEGNDDPMIAGYMEKSLNFKFLAEKMTEEYSRFASKVLKVKPKQIQEVLAKTMKKKMFDDQMDEAFNVYILFSYLSEYSKKVSEKITKTISMSSATTQKAYHFFRSNTGRIEIVLNNGRLFSYFFPIHPICGLLKMETKKQLLNSIPRSSVSEKINVHKSPLIPSQSAVCECNFLGK